jgi:hypothetical protein
VRQNEIWSVGLVLDAVFVDDFGDVFLELRRAVFH